jgi:hypothetical protein
MDARLCGKQVTASASLTEEGALIDDEDKSTHASPTGWAQHRITKVDSLPPETKCNGWACVCYRAPGTEHLVKLGTLRSQFVHSLIVDDYDDE